LLENFVTNELRKQTGWSDNRVETHHKIRETNRTLSAELVDLNRSFAGSLERAEHNVSLATVEKFKQGIRYVGLRAAPDLQH
jgi:hypothetical protein